MQVTVGLGHVDTLVDRGDVGRAGKWPDDTAGAENRQTTKNTQARVHGFQCQAFTILDVHRHFEAAVIGALNRQLLQVFGHHPSWHRVDGRFSHCQDQAWTSHRAHTGAGNKAHARLLQQSHAAEEQGTMGHIRVIACILERAGFSAILMQATELQTHLHLLALGQGDLHCIAFNTAQQQTRRGKAGGCGAAAGGQTAAQRGGLFLGFVTHQQA